jgi:hypothetical protein
LFVEDCLREQQVPGDAAAEQVAKETGCIDDATAVIAKVENDIIDAGGEELRKDGIELRIRGADECRQFDADSIGERNT